MDSATPKKYSTLSFIPRFRSSPAVFLFFSSFFSLTLRLHRSAFTSLSLYAHGKHQYISPTKCWPKVSKTLATKWKVLCFLLSESTSWLGCYHKCNFMVNWHLYSGHFVLYMFSFLFYVIFFSFLWKITN